MKLSIITVNLNNADGLRKTIESVVNQTFADYEFIIIDGGSTDGSIEVIKEYNEYITIWISESDSGIYNAMNKGISKAKGEYCLFLNSGDWLVKEVLREIVPHLYKKIDILYGNIYNCDNDGTIIPAIFPDSFTFSFLFEQYIPHAASFIKTSLFQKVGNYNVTYKICSDWEFFIKAIALQNCTFQHIPLFVTFFPLNGISSIYWNTIVKSERYKIMSELLPLFQTDYEALQKYKSNYNKNIIRWSINISSNRNVLLLNSLYKRLYKIWKIKKN